MLCLIGDIARMMRIMISMSMITMIMMMMTITTVTRHCKDCCLCYDLLLVLRSLRDTQPHYCVTSSSPENSSSQITSPQQL
jgi:hypothetical protein